MWYAANNSSLKQQLQLLQLLQEALTAEKGWNTTPDS
jgi:hypothetical protein